MSQPGGSPMLQIMLNSAKRASSFRRIDSVREEEEPEDEVLTFGWGANGQLGTGDRGSRVAPWRIASYKRVVSVAAGSRFTMILTGDGDVLSFGKNDQGQLGHGTRSEVMVPRRVDFHKRVVAIATRGSHCLALDAEGGLYSWGRGDEGQLGYDNSTGQLSPKLVTGFGNYARLTPHIACGRTHSLALDADGNVWSWGSGDDGAHGHGTHNMVTAPRKIENLLAKSLSAGSRHSAVLTTSGEVVTWGWGVYAQLGHRDRHDKLTPTAVKFPNQGGFDKIACGYRHTLVTRSRNGEDELWAFGWDAFGQCGVGRSTVLLTPTRVVLPRGKILSIGAGGGHSLACVEGAGTYSWGRGDDGQLGVPGNDNPRKSVVPRLPLLSGAMRFDCGWAHTVAVVKAQKSERPQKEEEHVFLFARGDFDGLFGQMLGLVLGFCIVQQLMGPFCGFSPEEVAKRVMPGAAVSTAFGAVAFAAQARATGSKTTAQPSGVSVVLMAAVLNQVCAPELAATKDPESAYGAALFVAFLVGLLELAMCPFLHQVQKHIPDAALHASVAGQALVALAMSFACKVFGAPADALPSLICCFVGYGAATRLPWNLPGGAAGMFLGALLAPILRRAFDDGAAGDADQAEQAGLAWHSPTTSLDLLLNQWGNPSSSLRYVAVAVPLAITNLANNIAMVESAAAVGDVFSVTESVAVDALSTIVGACFGCPFPTAIFIGHPAYKQMGARSGYMVVYAVLALFIGCSDATRTLAAWVPLAAGAGFMLWIGLACTASAFGRDDSSFVHAAPVALGLIPCIAAWGVQLIVACSEEQGQLDLNLDALKEHGLNVRGLCALSQGSLLSSVTLAAMLAHILERRFAEATAWCFLSSVLAGMGVIHSYQIKEGAIVADVGTGAVFRNPVAAQFALGYLGGSLILLGFWLRAADSELTPKINHLSSAAARALTKWFRRRPPASSSERLPLVLSTARVEIAASYCQPTISGDHPEEHLEMGNQ